MTAVNYLWNPINDNIVEEFDDAGNTIAEYTTESDLFGDVISQYRDGQESFYHTDGQGSTLALTNSNGAVTDTYAYSAFGEVTSQTGNTVNPFQYIGEKQFYRDVETGEYEVRRRTLSLCARWISPDPLRFADGPNGYFYSRNCPVLLIDPSGTKCIVCKWRRRVGGDDVDASDVGLADPIHRIGIDTWSLQQTLHGDINDWERTSPTHRKYSRPKVPKIVKYGPFAVEVNSVPPEVSYVITYAPYAIDAYVCGDDCLVTVIETGDEWVYNRTEKIWKQTEMKQVTKPFDNFKPTTVASGMGMNCMASLLHPAPKTGCNKMIVLTDIPESIHFVTGEEYRIRVVRQWIYISDGPFQDQAHSAYNKLKWKDTLMDNGPPWKASFEYVSMTSRTNGDPGECC